MPQRHAASGGSQLILTFGLLMIPLLASPCIHFSAWFWLILLIFYIIIPSLLFFSLYEGIGQAAFLICVLTVVVRFLGTRAMSLTKKSIFVGIVYCIFTFSSNMIYSGPLVCSILHAVMEKAITTPHKLNPEESKK